MKTLIVFVGLTMALASARPQHSKGFIPGLPLPEEEEPVEVEEIVEPVGFVPVREIIQYGTNIAIPVDADNLDINGCLVGPAGEQVCPQGSFGAGADRVTFRGNKGPGGNTGSNGNAGPIDAAGRPVDPAAVTYLKQIEAYKLWEKQQEENNKRIIG